MRTPRSAPWLVVMLGLLLLAACATTPTEQQGKPMDPATVSIPPDRSGLFVYRTEQPMARTTPASTILVDDQPVGQTSYRRYVYVELDTGWHTLRSSGDITTRLRFEAKPGTATYVWEEEPSRLVTHLGPQLRLVSEAEGKSGLQGATGAVGSFPPPPAPPPDVVQTLQVHLEIDGAPASEPVDCEASNDKGRWPFKAPGSVKVTVSAVPLAIRCMPPAGLAGSATNVDSNTPATRQEIVATGVKAGGLVGAAVGAGLAAAAFPFFGALGVMFIPGVAWHAAIIGGTVGMVVPEQARAYPETVTIQIKRGETRPE